MKLLVGLGNPGSEYSLTRHNVGFMFLDFLSIYYKTSWADKSKFQAQISLCPNFIMAKPFTYMNLSGKSVFALWSYYKIKQKHLAVIRDDKDLPLGEVRVKINSGSGGHNGIKSISEFIGPENYYQIKIGIGSPPEKFSTPSHVLGKFSALELEKIQESFEKIKNDFIKQFESDIL